MSRSFLQEYMQMANLHMKKCSMLLVMSKLRIKIFLNFFLYFERERQRQTQSIRVGEGQRARKGENLKQALHFGAWTHKPWDHNLSQSQEPGAQLTEPPRLPPVEILIRYYHTHTSMAKTKGPTPSNVGKSVGELGPYHGWWGRDMAQSLWKTLWRFLKKLNIHSPRESPILSEVSISKKWK